MQSLARFCLMLLAGLALVVSAAHAQQVRQTLIQFSSGTGFFINRDGNLITNAHVLKNCQSVAVMVNGKLEPASIVARDDQSDLAVVKTSASPQAIAPLRWNIKDLKVNDQLYLYGFPGSEGAKGKSSFIATQLLGMQGPTGEPQWLQLQSAAQQGNSGGPVLDSAGNVIAVIAGKAETYKVATSGNGQPQLVGKSDIAITLASLQDFLDKNHINSYRAQSGMVAYSAPIIAQNASRFTVPVRCVQSVTTR